MKAWRFQIGVELIVAHSIGAAMGSTLGVCSTGMAATLGVAILVALWWYELCFKSLLPGIVYVRFNHCCLHFVPRGGPGCAVS